MHHLAQLNIARARAALDDPSMAGFTSQIESIHALAECADGFVWRLQHYDIDTGRGLPAPDPRLVVTMSVWESFEALQEFFYHGDHRAALSRRADWFEPADGPNLVLWWISQSVVPRVGQGMARLRYLQLHGPTAWAFTFAKRFDPPDKVVGG